MGILNRLFKPLIVKEMENMIIEYSKLRELALKREIPIYHIDNIRNNDECAAELPDSLLFTGQEWLYDGVITELNDLMYIYGNVRNGTSEIAFKKVFKEKYIDRSNLLLSNLNAFREKDYSLITNEYLRDLRNNDKTITNVTNNDVCYLMYCLYIGRLSALNTVKEKIDD